ncbi:HNH endonuclease [Burkholderia ubonensis]|uniref:HNH endonuclease n=1 Tax=Burkholderia ubonensis TaxID=101571 RepID=UPI0007553F23|nr:HNH endonuclease [Burkholderia ubonensis]KVC81415.1 hypothetical protein WI75_08695 [Burkholderia ubonensis]
MRILPDFEEWPGVIAGFADTADSFEILGIGCVRPMIGGVFGFQRFWMSSAPYVKGGLDEVRYFVIERSCGVPFGIGDTKAAAISQARWFVTSYGDYFDSLVVMIIAERQRRQAERVQQAKDAARALIDEVRSARVEEKRIPRRRHQVFEKSNGCCHYCSVPLDLYGKWHVEHMMPKALGGSDEPGNLVASCVPCNMKKKDKTAEEFIAERAKQEAA